MSEFKWFSEQEVVTAKETIKQVVDGKAKHIAIPGVCGVTSYVSEGKHAHYEIIFENLKTGEKFVI